MDPDALVDTVLKARLPRPAYLDLTPLPVVVLEGPAGSGKTYALERLQKRWERSTPTLLVGMDTIPGDVRPHRIAVAVAAQLHCGPLPVHFRRLSLGLAARDVAVGELEHGESNLRRHLAQRDQVVSAVTTVVEQIAGELPNLNIPKLGADLVRSSFPPLAWALRRRARHFRWFATATGAGTPILGLLRLNNADDATADSLLVRAFLADLCASFTSWFEQEQFRSNVLLLLDDCHTTVGRRFLSALLQARTEERGESDPLLVVASSGRYTDSVLTPHPVKRETLLRSAIGGRWDRTHVTDGVYALPLLQNVPPKPGPPDERVYRALAAGHPEGELRLRRAALSGTAVAEVLDHAADRFLAGSFPPLREDLLAVAAVHPRDPIRAQLTAALTHSDRARSGDVADILRRKEEVERFVRDRLWAPPSTWDLQPFFRRALLHRLARLPEGEPGSWTAVLTRLGDEHTEDSPWFVHYWLARDEDVVAAARVLTRLLHSRRDRQSWIADVDVVTSAPCRCATPGANALSDRPDALPRDRSTPSGPELLVARIIRAVWRSRNLLGSPDLIEYLQAASALGELSQDLSLSASRREELLTRAGAYTEHHRMRTFLEPELPQAAKERR